MATLWTITVVGSTCRSVRTSAKRLGHEGLVELEVAKAGLPPTIPPARRAFRSRAPADAHDARVDAGFGHGHDARDRPESRWVFTARSEARMRAAAPSFASVAMTGVTLAALAERPAGACRGVVERAVGARTLGVGRHAAAGAASRPAPGRVSSAWCRLRSASSVTTIWSDAARERDLIARRGARRWRRGASAVEPIDSSGKRASTRSGSPLAPAAQDVLEGRPKPACRFVLRAHEQGGATCDSTPRGGTTSTSPAADHPSSVVAGEDDAVRPAANAHAR